ncbi:MAG: gamma-glutamyltransferase [Nocardioidaceae bacterium]|nr:gamma-glutamyltransferase [Nocardioidaceae bacterium]
MHSRRALLVAPALLVTTFMVTSTTPVTSGSVVKDAAAVGTGVNVPGTPTAPRAAAKRAVAVGTGGAVAAETVGGSRAGLAVLKRGGNAIDAAVATAAALGVDDPFVAGPGGGGFMVIYLADSKKIVTIDGRETCPMRCTPKLFLDKSGDPLDFELARHSGISVGVPGMVAQWAKATRLYGRQTLAQNLRPAIKLAESGFRVTQKFHDATVTSLDVLRAFSSSRKLFLTRDGQPLPVGKIFRNPDLAKTYQRLGTEGPSYLYGGSLGKAIAQTAQRPPVSKQAPSDFRVIPGIMTADDVRDYRAKNRPPTHLRYRGLSIYGMRPPSSGGTTIGEALNILSGWRLGSEPRARALFHYLEASRLAFADRGAYLGDSDYVPVPVSGLLSKKFAATRRCLVRGKALESPVAPGDPFKPYSTTCAAATATSAPEHEGTSTNHLVTADRWGNVVSYTNTIEQIAGTGITVPGYGFLLNNELTDFEFAPATPGAYAANLAAPGKRPRSSMSPTIVMRHGEPWLALGSPGGSTIITTVLQTLVNRIDFDMSLPKAIAAPRASQRNFGPSLVERGFARAPYARALRQRYGETFDVAEPPYEVIGFVNALEFLKPGLIQVATEPQRLGGGSVRVVNPRR